MGLCALCGALFRYAATGPRSRACSASCRTALWHKEHPKPARTYRCAVCDAPIVVRATGPRSLCDGCRSIGNSVAVVRLRLTGEERYVCQCGATFARPLTRGQRPRWCPSCRGTRKADAARKRANDARRRARTAIDAEQFEPGEIFERDRWRCQIPGCGRLVLRDKPWPHPLSPTIDHIIPLSEGGHHVRANVRCAHARCNVSRGNRGGNDQLLLIG